MSIHRQCGHPRIKRMLYFARMVNSVIDKDVRMVVKRCKVCQSIDTAQVQWKKGQLGASNARKRMGMDITHYGGNHFPTLIDCGPPYFAVWRLIAWQNSSSIIHQLLPIFFEQGAPEEILTNNKPTFCSQQVKQLWKEWGVWLQLQCAYVPSCKGITERSHCSIKKIVARKQCTISEATYWYNIMPKDSVSPATAPTNAINRYQV